MEKVIASRNLIAIKPSGEEVKVFIKIGTPFEERPHLWQCPTEIKGLYEETFELAGMDAYQAILSATGHVKFMLKMFLENNGKLYWASDRSTVSLSDGVF